MSEQNPGSEVGLPCPKHCGGRIIYDGNYKCCYLGMGCIWEMSRSYQGNPVSVRDKATMQKIMETAWYRRTAGKR